MQDLRIAIGVEGGNFLERSVCRTDYRLPCKWASCNIFIHDLNYSSTSSLDLHYPESVHFSACFSGCDNDMGCDGGR